MTSERTVTRRQASIRRTIKSSFIGCLSSSPPRSPSHATPPAPLGERSPARPSTPPVAKKALDFHPQLKGRLTSKISHSCAVLFQVPVTMRLPSERNTALRAENLCAPSGSPISRAGLGYPQPRGRRRCDDALPVRVDGCVTHAALVVAVLSKIDAAGGRGCVRGQKAGGEVNAAHAAVPQRGGAGVAKAIDRAATGILIVFGPNPRRNCSEPRVSDRWWWLI